MFETNIPSHLQNVAKYRVYKILKIGGLRHYQRRGNLKKGEVYFERGGSDPLGNYGLPGPNPLHNELTSCKSLKA